MAFLLIYLHITALCIMGGESLEPRTAIEGSFLAWGGLRKLDCGLGRGETFFPDSDSDETFQISQKLGLVHVEFFCLLDSQPCFTVPQPFLFKSFVVSQSFTVSQSILVPQSFVVPQYFAVTRSFEVPLSFAGPQSFSVSKYLVVSQSFAVLKYFAAPQYFTVPQSFAVPRSFEVP